jgi:hypothetical protein
VLCSKNRTSTSTAFPLRNGEGKGIQMRNAMSCRFANQPESPALHEAACLRTSVVSLKSGHPTVPSGRPRRQLYRTLFHRSSRLLATTNTGTTPSTASRRAIATTRWEMKQCLGGEEALAAAVVPGRGVLRAFGGLCEIIKRDLI